MTDHDESCECESCSEAQPNPGGGYELAPSTQMLATHCVFCNRALRDAESVERGCGPDCAKEYGVLSASQPPDWKRYLELAEQSPDFVKARITHPDMLVKAQAGDAWGTLNVLIHLAGAKWETKARDANLVIGAIAEMASALGYPTVGQKLISRYVIGESSGPKIESIVVTETRAFNPRRARPAGELPLLWQFYFPWRIGSAFRDMARAIENAGGWINAQANYAVQFPPARWIKILNCLVPTFSGVVGVLPTGELFVVPNEPLAVPAEDVPAAGGPEAQTGQDGFDKRPPPSSEELKPGMEVELRDGTKMYVRKVGFYNGTWRVGLHHDMLQAPRFDMWAGLEEIRLTKPSAEEKKTVEEKTEEPLPEPARKIEIPETFRPYQREGALWLEAQGSGILAFEPRLGKSATALVVAESPTLVICPNNVKVNWMRECARWRPDQTAAAIGVGKEPSQKDKKREHFLAQLKADVVILNYEQILDAWRFEQLAARKFKTLIVDEAHRLKELRVYAKKQPDGSWKRETGKGTKTATAIWKLRQDAKRAFLLTGTPSMNGRNYELFPLCHLVAPEQKPFRTFNEYCKQYCPGQPQHVGGGQYVTVYTSNDNTHELYELLNGKYMLRKKQSELNLPEKVRQSVYVSMDEDVAKEYRRAAAEFLAWVRSIGGPEAAARAARAEAIARMTALRRLSAIGKAPSVAEAVVEHVIGTGRPIVIMCHHSDAATQIQSFLEAFNETGKLGSMESSRKIAVGTYGWGHTKQETLDAFQRGLPEEAPPEDRQYLDVLVASIMAVKEGIPLHRATDMYFVEREWRPGDNVQAENRMVEVVPEGQTAPGRMVTYYEASGTIDGYIAELLQDKEENIAKVLDGIDLTDEESAMRVMGAMLGALEDFARNSPSGEDTPDWADPE